MTKINIMSQQKYEQQLTHIFLLLIPVQCFVPFKFTPNVSQFLIDAFDFGFFTFACVRVLQKEWIVMDCCTGTET